MIGGADHVFLFHAVHDAGGAVVADLQMALDEAGRGLALARHQGHGLVVEIGAFALAAGGAAARLVEFGDRRIIVFGDFLDIAGDTLALEEIDYALDFAVGDEGAVDAGDAAATGHVEHVAAAEQLFGAGLAQDGAAVDLRRHLEADAGREIGLDRAGDDVDRGALRRHNDVDTGGA